MRGYLNSECEYSKEAIKLSNQALLQAALSFGEAGRVESYSYAAQPGRSEAARLYDQIVGHYYEEGRFYHKLRHVAGLFQLLAGFEHRFGELRRCAFRRVVP